jgi:hypothetical protein
VRTQPIYATGATIYEPPLACRAPERRICLNDRVSVPDGRVGGVIGFYCRDVETVVVRFGPGDSVEYPASDLVIQAALSI